MRTLELTEEEFTDLQGDVKSELGDYETGEMSPLYDTMEELIGRFEETADTNFVNRLCGYFDELKEFDVKTREVALFKESLEALQRVLPDDLQEEPLVVGSYLMKIMHNPDTAGLIIAQAWELGRKKDY